MGKISTNFSQKTLVVPQLDFQVCGVLQDITGSIITGKFLDYAGSFRADGDVRKIVSLANAVVLGINDDHRDETKATDGVITVSTASDAGQTIRLYLNPKMGNKQLLAELVVTSAMSTTALIAAALCSALNTLTYKHGFTGTYTSGATFTLTAPSKQGASINGAGIVTCEVYTALNTLDNTSDVTLSTPFSGGVGSEIAVLYYQLKRLYLNNPTATVWVKLKASPVADDLISLRNTATSNIYQYAIALKTSTGATGGSIAGVLSSYDTAFATLETAGKYGIGIVKMDMYNGTAITDSNLCTAFPNQRLGKKHVTIDIGLSGAADDYFKGDKTASISEGYKLQGIYDYSIGTWGDWLGIRSSIGCNESVANTVTGDLQTDGEYLSACVANGQSVKTLSVTYDNAVRPDGLLEVNGYLFPRSDDRYSGVFYCTDQNCEVIGLPYAESKSLSTVYKFASLVVSASKPIVESQVIIDPKTGKLTDDSKIVVGSAADLIKETMVTAKEISDSTNTVSDTINAGKVSVLVSITPTYTVKTLEYNINLN